MQQKQDGKKLFEDSDDQQISQDDPVQRAQSVLKMQTSNLYEDNLNKYMNYLRQFSTNAQQKQQNLFQDGIACINHPLIQISQINYQKNFGIFDLVDISNNNNAYTRSMVVFTFLDNQVNKIIQILQLNLYDSLLMYGQQSIKDSSKMQTPQIMTAKSLTLYKKIYDLVRKLMSYIQNTILQLHSMINKKQPHYKTIFKNINLDFAIDIIGRALRAIYIIDCIVQNNRNILQHWQIFKKLLKLARNQPQKFNTSIVNIKRLQKSSMKFENTVISRKCMQTIINIKFDQIFQKNKSQLGLIKNNKQLRQYLQLYFNRILQQINQNLGTKQQLQQDRKLLDLMCVYALFRRLFPAQQARSTWRDLWSMQKKLPIVQGHSFVCIYISNFMQVVCPLSKKSKSMDPKDQNIFLKQYIDKLGQTIGVDFVSNYTKFCVWLSRMESIVTSNNSLKDLKRDDKAKKIISQRLSNRVTMLWQGLTMIMKMNKLLYLCFMLHINQQRPINKQLLGNMILCMQSLKATVYILKKKADAFDTMILSKHIAKQIYLIIQPFYRRIQIDNQNKKKIQNIQKLSALKLLLVLLDTPVSQLKITLIKYSISFLRQNIFNKQQYNQLINLVKRLQIVCYHSVLIQKFQNCSYLYYCKQILSKIFQWKQQNPNTCKRLQFLFDTFQDSAFLILKCPHLNNQQQLFIQYKKYIIKQFQQYYMKPLKRKVQDFLRISTHFMLIQKLQGVNPYQMQMTDLTKLVQFQKIRIFDSIIDIKLQISKALNQTFYNINVLNMYDMQTYQQMRILGSHLFDLSLHDVFLPSVTIQQGKFDIMSIIRNIPKFIQTYKYNLLSQKFLQVTGQGKIISCISIQQLSDSIRTHGLGILATTVNAFYKFLTTKVHAFNKFLYDDYIQSPLVKQKKWLKDFAGNQNYVGYYPYQRAQYLYKQIKKIGKFQDGTNFLDKFRQTITAVGNSLGFVRLLRSASLNSSSKNVQFLPKKLQINQSFYQLSQKTSLSQSTRSSFKQLDDILKSLDNNFGGKTDYLALMIKVFSKIVTKQNKHLRLFYLIIPALSLNYIQHVARGKQQINKKLSSRAFLYDDGFIFGLSYFLNLLKQTQQYKTMHWDISTKQYFQASKNYSKQVSTSNHSAKFVQDLNMQKQLLIKKLELMQQQFTFYNLNIVSANVLFQGNNVDNAAPASPPSG